MTIPNNLVGLKAFVFFYQELEVFVCHMKHVLDVVDPFLFFST